MRRMVGGGSGTRCGAVCPRARRERMRSKRRRRPAGEGAGAKPGMEGKGAQLQKQCGWAPAAVGLGAGRDLNHQTYAAKPNPNPSPPPPPGAFHPADEKAERGPAVLVHPDDAVRRLKAFVEVYDTGPSRAGGGNISGPLRVQGLLRRAAEREQEFWARMTHVVRERGCGRCWR